MPKERPALVGRTPTTRLPLCADTALYQSPKQSIDESIDQSTEPGKQRVHEPTNIIVREEDIDQVDKLPTTNDVSDPKPIALLMYQRIAEELHEENPEPENQVVISWTDVNGREEATSQSERAPSTQSSPALEPSACTDAKGLLDKTAQLERRWTWAPPEIQNKVPRVLTVPHETKGRRSSAAPCVTPSTPGLEPSAHTDAEACHDWTPQIEGRQTRVPTKACTTDRRRSSAVPGITALPLETIHEDSKVGAQTKNSRRRPKKGANYAPRQQYPPAPAYPLRETPL
jgi:hypothetical protein